MEYFLNKEVFFAVDCGTLSHHLLESELFGHTKGAFTGAHENKQGIFKLADGGTIFLDEISNISPQVQGKLLRFLETREFLPIGAGAPLPVNVRLVFAIYFGKAMGQKLFSYQLAFILFLYVLETTAPCGVCMKAENSMCRMNLKSYHQQIY